MSTLLGIGFTFKKQGFHVDLAVKCNNVLSQLISFKIMSLQFFCLLLTNCVYTILQIDCTSDEGSVYSETAAGIKHHGHYCGTAPPPSITSEANVLLVLCHSNYDVTLLDFPQYLLQVVFLYKYISNLKLMALFRGRAISPKNCFINTTVNAH